MFYWKKLSHSEQDQRITKALEENVDYKQKLSLGIPASRLDPQVFYDQATFLKDAPMLRAYVQNPNHIGCHTLGDSEAFFRGTQELEKELIELLSVDVFKSSTNSCDGYVAAGGTEANIQAMWVYRNYYFRQFDASASEIAIVCSEDTHYSVYKAGNLLGIAVYTVPVNAITREIQSSRLDHAIDLAVNNGIKYFIIIANMGTTMFGSVDDPDVYVRVLEQRKLPFKLHVDGAFGGFVYPFSRHGNQVNFNHPYVSSITLDAHKMLQAPYGTGIFLVKKGLIEFVYTEQAQYVNGMDITLSGSRSGANAIAVWMILSTYGPHGWLEKVNKLLYRTSWCCDQLGRLSINYYRHPDMNIIAISSNDVPETIAAKYGLVPDTHQGSPKWFKIVVMDHVELNHLQDFIADMQAAEQLTSS